MKKNRNKTSNYSGRNRIELIAQNYSYNLLDYLYYQGKRYEKRWPASCSGPMMLSWYWCGIVWFPALFLLLPEWAKAFKYCHPLAVVGLALAALELPPALWCLFRYRRERVAAIKHHYRQRGHTVSVGWILSVPALFMIATVIFILTRGYNP